MGRMPAVALAMILLFSACGTGPPLGDDCRPKGTGNGSAARTVKVVADPATVGAYQPKEVAVKPGESVTWDFKDSSVQHSVTSDDGSSFDSCLLSAGAKITVTFTTAGTFPYHCTIHPAMTGTVKAG